MERQRKSSMCHVDRQKSQAVIEESEDEVERVEETRYEPDGGENVDGLPWHHAQLVLLYGRHVADEFIKPKMEQRRQVKVNSKLKKGKAVSGAAQLWSMLRNDSTGKLLTEDKMIPTDLKESYGAFVRQLVLQKGQVPVKRNFYETEDVADMDHLLDRRRLLKTMDLRHKIELMGRSSKLNQDKTNLLVYNNPLPNLNNAEGVEGIDRYLPSRIDEDEESIASYRKWIGEKQTLPELVPIKPSESLMELVRPLARDTSRHRAASKVTFLTEVAAASERGTFSDKYKERREADNSVVNPVSMSANVPLDNVQVKHFRGDNIKSSSSSEKNLVKKKTQPKSTWEPLTLNALIEYSDKRNTRGTGQFRHGTVKMYPISNSTAKTP